MGLKDIVLVGVGFPVDLVACDMTVESGCKLGSVTGPFEDIN